MNKKQIYILIGILGFLAAGVLLKGLQTPRGLVIDDAQGLAFSFDSAQAAKITVVRGGQEVLSAAKQGDGWILPALWNARASENAIQSLLNMLSQARGELRSDDAALFDDFGISDSAAVQVKVQDASGKPLLDLLAGTKKAGAGSNFVRRAGSNAVYLSDINLEGVLGIYGDLAKDPVKPEVLADLEPLKLSHEDFRSVEVRRSEAGGPRTVIALKQAAVPKTEANGAKTDWGFAADYGRFQLDPQKAEGFLRTLAALKAQNVADPSGSYSLEQPVLEIKIGTDKPDPIVIAAGAENADKTGRYFRIGKDPQVYLLSSYFFDHFMGDDSKFFKPGFLAPALENNESIGLLKQKAEKRLAPQDPAYPAVLARLKNLTAASLLLSDAEKKLARSPGTDQITLTQKGGKTLVLDLGERLEKDPGHGARYAAAVRGEAVLFTLSEADYDALFEVFKPVPEAPADVKTSPSQGAANKAQ